MSSRIYFLSGLLLLGGAILAMPRRAGEEHEVPSKMRLPKVVSSGRESGVMEGAGNKTIAAGDASVSSAAMSGSGKADRPGFITRPAIAIRHGRSTGSGATEQDRMPLLFCWEDEELIARIPEVPQDGWSVLREEFVRETGAGELDPSSPEYESRWQQAEATLQERIRSLYGWGAWAAYQREKTLGTYAASGAR